MEEHADLSLAWMLLLLLHVLSKCLNPQTPKLSCDVLCGGGQSETSSVNFFFFLFWSPAFHPQWGQGIFYLA